MAKAPPDMTSAEFDVMKALWRIGSGAVADVRRAHAEMFDSDLAYTTVMTLLGRLASKGAVTVDKGKQPFVYEPAYRRESVLRQRLKRFVDKVFDGDADALLLQLVEDEDLSSADLARIRRRIDELEESEDDGGD